MKLHLPPFILAVGVGALLLPRAVQGQVPQASATSRSATPKGVGFLTPHMPYPISAVKDRMEGTGVLEVSFDSQGNATKAVMITSTGHSILDRTATSYAKAHWKNLTGKPKVLRMNISFRLPR